MQMCSTWSLAKTELVLNCLKQIYADMTYCREGKGLKAALGVCFAELTATETYGSCALSA